jgi:1-acyl-sn-glycerol-3-phosphate acyltransferase
MWDAPVMLGLTRRRTVLLADEELRHFPWLHWTLHHLWDAIYLRRGEGDTRAVDEALAVLGTGVMVGLAPEGIRSPEGLRQGLTGVAHLSRRSGAPVVPVAVFGQERISASARRLRRAPVRIRIAPPIAPFDGEPTADALRAWTDRIMTEIARRLPAAYRGVYADSASDAGVLD